MFFWDTNCVIDFETAFSQQWVVFQRRNSRRPAMGAPFFSTGRCTGHVGNFCAKTGELVLGYKLPARVDHQTW